MFFVFLHIYNKNNMIKNTKIYLVINCYNDYNKVYIGKTINKSRKNDHKRKYGPNIIFKILEEIKGTNKNLWKPRESYWIQHYLNSGFEVLNKQLKGGSGVEYHSEETKNKIKEWKKQNRIRVRKDIEDKKHDIIKQYISGSGAHIISSQYGCHPDVIKRILRENNVSFRTPSNPTHAHLKLHADVRINRHAVPKSFPSPWNVPDVLNPVESLSKWFFMGKIPPFTKFNCIYYFLTLI